ncbi:WD40-repeat-containing domain protein [Gautieria morchelliformis]|nr:WD40-repeat-containing domain protein [Gautieria morchelliformis]
MTPTDGAPSDTSQPTQSEALIPYPTPSPPSPSLPLPVFDTPSHDDVKKGAVELPPKGSDTISPEKQQPARKLCVRHQRMADEGTSLKLQQSLNALPLKERETVNRIWSDFSVSSHPRRELILHGILTMCCFSQLSLLTEQLQHLIRLDPFHVFPREVALKVLQSLDAISLGRAAQVSKHWRSLADDNILWKNICEQHIDKKCSKCGWGLPLLEKRRIIRSPLPLPPSPAQSSSSLSSQSSKRDIELSGVVPDTRPHKRHKPDRTDLPDPPLSPPGPRSRLVRGLSDDCDLTPSALSPVEVTRPWKDVYCERLTIERNWRRGRCSVRTLQGHTDGVMCMQFSETLPHPAFPVLITGSYDRTVRVWNMESGTEVRCLRGHTRAVRALQFDEAKLITGSMDRTLRIWDWRNGKCIRTLEGHTEGVVCLHFDANILVSGSVDTTVKVWNFRSGACFTLRGHHDWVNSVAIWDRPDVDPIQADVPAGGIDLGKMLFSASDDGAIKLWDLNRRTCIREFIDHVGQVQSIRVVTVDPNADENELLAPSPEDEEDSKTEVVEHRASRPPYGDPRSTLASGLPGWAPASVSVPTHLPADHPGFDAPEFDPPPGFDPHAYRGSPGDIPPPHGFAHADNENAKGKGKQRSRSSTPGRMDGPTPVLVSGSLDNTIKVWDVETGKVLKTLFGHIEGVWSIACDKLRLVSGSHDRTIKVWVREEGRCMVTLVGHRGAVTCLSLGDDKIVSGSDDGDIKIWSFSP